MSASMRVTGDVALKKTLRMLPGKVEKKVVFKALREGAKPIKKQMVSKVNRLSGELAKSFQIRRRKRTGNLFILRIRSKARHAHLVEYGHGGPHPAPAYPFFRPAFETKADEAQGNIQTEMRQGVERETRLLAKKV